jgi:hypothetical protein
MSTSLDMDEFSFLFSWLWKFAITVIILCNFKCLPLAWHVSARQLLVFQMLWVTMRKQIRILRGYRYLLRSNRLKRPVPEQLFQPLIISSGNSLTELDYNLHSKV